MAAVKMPANNQSKAYPKLDGFEKAIVLCQEDKLLKSGNKL